MDENIFKADVQRIKAASEAGKLVVLVGAGVSANSGVPMWWDLIESFKKELPKATVKNVTDYLKLAQLYKDQRKHKEYLEKVKTELKHGRVSPNPVHEAILALKPAHIITTNYDDLLEQAVRENNAQYYTISKDANLPYASYNQLLIKMHGDFDEGNIVLTEEDYHNYDVNFPLIDSYVKALFASHLVVLIGFSFDDLNLKIITNKVRRVLRKDFQYMYMLTTSKESDALSGEYFKNKGVKILGYGINKEEEDGFEQKYLQPLKKLGDSRGQKLYKLIRYIEDYNPFKDRWEKAVVKVDTCDKDKETFLDVLYDIVQYHRSEVEVVGGKNLLNFYPLRETNTKSTFAYFSLATDLFDELNQQLKKSFAAKRCFLKHYRGSVKYQEIIQFVRINNIYQIELKGGNGDKKIIHLPKVEKKFLGLESFFVLDFTNLNRRIDELKLRKNLGVSIDDLEYPYLLYKLGRYEDAYLRFKELAHQYWKAEKYVLYFICQINRKNLTRLLEAYFWDKFRKEKVQLSPEEKALIEEAEQIDLQDILANIQTQNKEIYQVLLKVKDFTYVYKVIHSANKIAVKTKKLSRTIYVNNALLPHEELIDEVYHLWHFTNYNFIVSEHYTEHKAAYLHAFESFMVSHNTPEDTHIFKSPDKLQEIQHFHILLALFSFQFKDLKKIFEENSIQYIKLYEGDKNKIQAMAHNIVDSVGVVKNQSQRLKDSIYSAFNNLFLILSKVEFEEGLYKKIIERITYNRTLALLEVQDALVYFMDNLPYHIGIEMWEALLEECFVRQERLPDKLIKAILRKVTQHDKKYKITNEAILSKISHPDLLEEHRFLERQLIIVIYHLLPEKTQRNITKELNNILENKFDKEMFRLADALGIPLSTAFQEQFVKEAEEFYKKGTSSNIYNALQAIALTKIHDQSKDEKLKVRIKKLIAKLPLLGFLLEPEKYKAYDSFEIDWLQLLGEKQYKILAEKVQVKEKIQEALKKQPNQPWLLDLYFKYFSK